MNKPLSALGVIFLLTALSAGGWLVWNRKSAVVKLDTTYHAVLLDNGQVYYGKIQGLGTEFPILTEVYYVQNQVNPQTKEVTNLLVRRGKEWHGPDRMILNARHIVLVEPVSPDSKVAQLISQGKK